jgi:hypothetical protein
MKHNIRHIVLLSVVLALIGVLVISSAAFAADGSQAHAGPSSQNGNTYGPGDGTGPIGGGQFGPGPLGKCLDANGDGICDCQQ